VFLIRVRVFLACYSIFSRKYTVFYDLTKAKSKPWIESYSWLKLLINRFFIYKKDSPWHRTVFEASHSIRPRRLLLDILTWSFTWVFSVWRWSLLFLPLSIFCCHGFAKALCSTGSSLLYSSTFPCSIFWGQTIEWPDHEISSLISNKVGPPLYEHVRWLRYGFMHLPSTFKFRLLSNEGIFVRFSKGSKIIDFEERIYAVGPFRNRYYMIYHWGFV